MKPVDYSKLQTNIHFLIKPIVKNVLEHKAECAINFKSYPCGLILYSSLFVVGFVTELNSWRFSAETCLTQVMENNKNNATDF